MIWVQPSLLLLLLLLRLRGVIVDMDQPTSCPHKSGDRYGCNTAYEQKRPVEHFLTDLIRTTDFNSAATATPRERHDIQGTTSPLARVGSQVGEQQKAEHGFLRRDKRPYPHPLYEAAKWARQRAAVLTRTVTVAARKVAGYAHAQVHIGAAEQHAIG